MSTQRRYVPLAAALLTLLTLAALPCPAAATTSGRSVPSPLGGNGHNVSFDGRVYIVRQGPDAPNGGWSALILRPERVAYDAQGYPDVSGAFAPPALIQPFESGENALAICETSAERAPYPCDDAGNDAPNGPFACYDFVIIDSNAYANQHNNLRARNLRLQLENPNTADAAVRRWWWMNERTGLRSGANRELRGIEPTVTADGRLLLWQGHPDNDGKIDILMYATNDNPCALNGWDGPHNLSHMFNDPRVRGRYRLAERQLRAADGTPFSDGALVRGAYPWLFPEGDALIFAATTVPCRSENNPPGCGPRRGAISVLGYPTNWGISHIDGGINPDTDQTVRLFFSSPGPNAFAQLPATPGLDVWPFFGSNTSNYTEVIFDDGLDGNYAGVWHMNESVDVNGNLDRSRTPDTSGYYNTGLLRNVGVPLRNNAVNGKALEFNGQSSFVEVPHNPSLNPVNALTIELRLRMDSNPDCDGNNNYRFLLGKGNINEGAWTIVLEEGGGFQARVKVGGQQRAIYSNQALTPGQWHDIAITYDGGTGLLATWIDGQRTNEAQGAPGTLDGSSHPITIGSPGANRPACPSGDGAFHGLIDEVRISRVARDLASGFQSGNHSAFVSQSVPGAVEPGASFSIAVTLQNRGSTTWTTAGSYRLGSQSPQDNGRWGTGRIELPHAVPPGDAVTFTPTLTAPAQEGLHDMQWRMVQDGVEWFGAFTPTLQLRVQTGASTEPDAGLPDVDEPDVAQDVPTAEDTTPGEDVPPGEDAAPDAPDDPGDSGNNSPNNANPNNSNPNNNTANNNQNQNNSANNSPNNATPGNNGNNAGAVNNDDGPGGDGLTPEPGAESASCACATPQRRVPGGGAWLLALGVLGLCVRALRRR